MAESEEGKDWRPPELREAIGRFGEQMGSMDELTHVTLKGHLLIEEKLTEILDQHVFHREHLAEARLTFAQKIHIARALCLRKNKYGEWELIAAINALRNELAHQLNSPNREKRLAKVRNLYIREAGLSKNSGEIKMQSDASMLTSVCAHCCGLLVAYLSDSKGFRALTYSMDRTMNPNEPPFEL